MSENPSAFPQSLTDSNGAFVGCEGMTLRDYFAAAAAEPAAEWINNATQLDRANNHPDEWLDRLGVVASWKFKYADAMLKARGAK